MRIKIKKLLLLLIPLILALVFIHIPRGSSEVNSHIFPRGQIHSPLLPSVACGANVIPQVVKYGWPKIDIEAYSAVENNPCSFFTVTNTHNKIIDALVGFIIGVGGIFLLTNVKRLAGTKQK